MEDFLSELVRTEVVVVFSALFLGMAYAAVYDTIRIIRRVIPHRRVTWIAVEDILFWIAAALHAYVTFYNGTDGIIRGYIVVGMVCGAVLYRMSAGVFYVRYVTIVIKFMLKPLKKLKVMYKIHMSKG